MHKIIASDDFRKAAEDVRVRSEDTIPVEGELGMWRLPEAVWMKMPEIYKLVNLYNKTKYDSIKERAAHNGLQLDFDGGWEILLLAGALSVPRYKMRVAIVLPRPFEQQCGPPTVLEGRYEADGVPGDTGNPPKPLKAGIPPGPRPQPHKAIVKESPIVEQKISHQANENFASKSPKVSEGLTAKEVDANTLQQQPQVLITRRLTPPGLGVGDILELYYLDGLLMENGVVLMILMRYSVKKVVKAIQDDGQDRGRIGAG